LAGDGTLTKAVRCFDTAPHDPRISLYGTECGRRITQCGKDAEGDREVARRRNSRDRPASVRV